MLETSAMGWCRQNDGRFRDDLIDGNYSPEDFEKRNLPRNHGIQQHVSADRHEVAYWRETASGWILGIAVRRVDARFDEWLYAGAVPPNGVPQNDPDAWGERFGTPPDWM
jgi:hypothetical protein